MRDDRVHRNLQFEICNLQFEINPLHRKRILSMNRASTKPRGFTLIELMVAISIIALLAALVSVAVARAITRAKETRIELELDQLAAGIELYKKEYGSYPPSTRQGLLNHIRSIFPRLVEQDLATLPPYMNAAEILVFCVRGYTGNPQRPIDYFNNNVKRDNFYEFETGRLRTGRTFEVTIAGTKLSGKTWVYVPVADKEAPYVYFDCSRPTGVSGNQPNFYWPLDIARVRDDRFFPPQWEANAKFTYTGPRGSGELKPYVTVNALTLANAGKFQIISAGLDGDFGNFVRPRDVKGFPSGDNYTEGDKDNLVNFSERNLENSRP